MRTINDMYVNALLADAAYAENLVDDLHGDELARTLSSTMTQPQATYIAANFSVVSHIESDDLTGSGFDATVWRGNDGTPYAGRFYVSMQGTQGLGDFLSDIDLAKNGAARAQYVDMVNWWLRITTPVNHYVPQIRPRAGMNGLYFEPGGAVVGSGQLVGVSRVEVNGHSLGGHLASAFARIFGASIGIDHVTTFNSAGFGGGSEAVFAQLQTLLNTGTEGFLGGVQTNVFAEHGINVTTNGFFFNQIGQRISIFNEEGFTIPNHLMYKLTDTLALCDVLGLIDGSLSLADATQILDAASSEPAAALETLLDALRGLYWKAEDKTPVGDAGDSAATRVAYHENLDFLRRMLESGALPGGEIISLVGQAPAAVGAQAAEEDEAGLAVRYALMALNPFALVGADYSLHNGNGELELQDEETDEGALSENWLKDRARMLSAKIAVNTTDNNGASPAYFRDIATNTVLGGNLFGLARRTVFGGDGADTLEGGLNDDRLYGGGGADRIDGGMSADYIEGGTGADRLAGDSGNDELWGGAGEDILVGGSDNDQLLGGADDDTLYGDAESEDDTGGFFGAGNDRLEGGAGNDRLYGGAGKDVLLGGDGDDTLRGGRGAADYLVGGTGADTYIYKSEDGADLIWDEDGQGHIEYDGATLTGGRGKSKNSRVFYDNPDAPDYTYGVSGDLKAGPVTLTISRAQGGGQLTVYDFYDGDLGIHLEDGDDKPGKPPRAPRPPAPAQAPGNQSRGDPLVIDLTGTGISTYGLDRNLHFDHDNDAFAEKSGWAAAGSGVLVLDANADATLNDGQELFGDFTVLPGGQLAANGFQALSQYDRNCDGVIDANDPVWQHLRVAVWESGPRGETVLGDPATAMSLKTLDELGIESISLDSTITATTDANGNTRTRSGQITLADGTTREIAEYRFARDNSETRFLDWRPLPETIAVLPELTLGGIGRNCLNNGDVPTCTC